MERDRAQTEQSILDAVGRILAREGFRRIGINAVAREAGVDKVLIYRYFGGLPQVLRAFGDRGGFWPTAEELLGRYARGFRREELPRAVETLLLNHFRLLRSRPVTQAVMRWELLERNELTAILAEARERQGLRLLELLREYGGLGERDIAAAAALIHEGISYLVLRAETADGYLGVDIRAEKGAGQLETAVRELVTLLFAGKPDGETAGTSDGEAGSGSMKKGRSPQLRGSRPDYPGRDSNAGPTA